MIDSAEIDALVVLLACWLAFDRTRATIRVIKAARQIHTERRAVR